MKGDFTRLTFKAARHYTSVLMQQGRVQLDADWNEQAAIASHRLRTALSDLIGPHGGPAAHLGFGVVMDAAGVDALLNADGSQLSVERKARLKQLVAGGDLVLSAGRYYVNGVMAENEAPFAFSEQTGYPFGDPGIDKLRAAPLALIYLDVFERHLSASEADGLRETALGGVDTATRIEAVAQVRGLIAPAPRQLAPVFAPSAARLRAVARLADEPQDACVIAADSRYRGLENQLYRVEIHRGGPARGIDGNPAGATFKWSRENGSVVLPVASIEPSGSTTLVKLAVMPRDDKLGFARGQWVELADDVSVLSGLQGRLLQVHSVDGLALKLEGTPDFSLHLDRHPIVRRWDHGGADTDGGALLVIEGEGDKGWIELEDGIRVQFEGTDANVKVDYHSGDYWLIPARTALGDIEWPEGEALPPLAVPHAYAPLAAIERNAAGAVTVKDLRLKFAGIAA